MDIEEKIDKILKEGIPIEGTTLYVRVKLKDIKFSYEKEVFNVMVNLNEFVDSLSIKLGKSSLINLIVLCYKKLEELEGK